MKKFIFLVLFSVFMCSAQASQPVFYDAQGNAIHLPNLKDKWIIINYWAGWCSACMQEIPELNHFYKDIKDKNISFYGVNYDDLSLSELKSSIASAGIEFPILTADPGYLWNLNSIDVIPTTFIIDPKGRVVKEITGPNTEQSLMNTLSTLQNK